MSVIRLKWSEIIQPLPYPHIFIVIIFVVIFSKYLLLQIVSDISNDVSISKRGKDKVFPKNKQQNICSSVYLSHFNQIDGNDYEQKKIHTNKSHARNKFLAEYISIL